MNNFKSAYRIFTPVLSYQNVDEIYWEIRTIPFYVKSQFLTKLMPRNLSEQYILCQWTFYI